MSLVVQLSNKCGLFSCFCWFVLPADLQLDYSLTDDFCQNHFLVGLLLREVGAALQEHREIRQISVQVLKGLQIKHTFDDRYAAKVSSGTLTLCFTPCFKILVHLGLNYVWTLYPALISPERLLCVSSESPSQTGHSVPASVRPPSGERLQTGHQRFSSSQQQQCKSDTCWWQMKLLLVPLLSTSESVPAKTCQH